MEDVRTVQSPPAMRWLRRYQEVTQWNGVAEIVEVKVLQHAARDINTGEFIWADVPTVIQP